MQRFTWNLFERILRTLEVVIIMITVIVGALQLMDVRKMQSMQLMIEFDKQLNEGTNAQVIDAIENNERLFKENGGHFSEGDIDRYLGPMSRLIAQTKAGS